jgi:thiol-disulfide isomerase/thioredoxin
MRRFFPVIFLLPLAGCTAETTTQKRADAEPGLAVGKSAPSLEGADVNGKFLGLSEFRGKVVAVDFWATWCGPCRRMIPHEKQLVKRMQGRPFVLLGVSDDRTDDALKDFIKKEGITWPNIFDGYGGPITRAWKVSGFPTVHLIDVHGVIRYFDIDGEDLDKAVEKLVAEAEAGT